MFIINIHQQHYWEIDKMVFWSGFKLRVCAYEVQGDYADYWLLEVLGVLKKRLKVKKFRRFCQWFITVTCVGVYIAEVCWYLQEARNSRRCCKLIGRLTWTQIQGLGEYSIHIHILCVSLLTSWEWGCMRWGCGRSTSSRCRPRRSRGRSTDTSRTSPSQHHHCK